MWFALYFYLTAMNQRDYVHRDENMPCAKIEQRIKFQQQGQKEWLVREKENKKGEWSG